MQETELSLEIYTDEDGNWHVFIGNEDGSGADYPVENADDVAQAVKFYIETYLE